MNQQSNQRLNQFGLNTSLTEMLTKLLLRKSILEIQDEKITACGLLLISADNKILAFARRGDRNKLGFPAGERNPKEDLVECAERECFEECGLGNLDFDLSNSDVFCYIPDDRQKQAKEEYCVTFIVRSDKSSEEFQIGEANNDAEGNSEGFDLWVSPEEFISGASSAFKDYNTMLLKVANLV